jgi:hypothetical protein
VATEGPILTVEVLQIMLHARAWGVDNNLDIIRAGIEELIWSIPQ